MFLLDVELERSSLSNEFTLPADDCSEEIRKLVLMYSSIQASIIRTSTSVPDQAQRESSSRIQNANISLPAPEKFKRKRRNLPSHENSPLKYLQVEDNQVFRPEQNTYDYAFLELIEP